MWTADGRVGFTRWDELKRPYLHVADPARGVDAAATAAAAHPVPRMTVAHVVATGELLVTGNDYQALHAWDPVTARERRVPIEPEVGVAAVASRDGRWLAILGNDRAVWRVPFGDGRGGRDRRRAERVWAPPPCATLDRPAWDSGGRLHVAYRPWAGDVYVVPTGADGLRRE